MTPPCRPGVSALARTIGLPLVGALALWACGAGDDANLSPLAREGKEIAADSGCAACHGTSGQGGVGPAWTGLYRSTVLLDDGTSVVADADYLRRSIVEPGAQKVDGFNILMPPNTLSDDQIDVVIAYIRELE